MYTFEFECWASNLTSILAVFILWQEIAQFYSYLFLERWNYLFVFSLFSCLIQQICYPNLKIVLPCLDVILHQHECVFSVEHSKLYFSVRFPTNLRHERNGRIISLNLVLLAVCNPSDAWWWHVMCYYKNIASTMQCNA